LRREGENRAAAEVAPLWANRRRGDRRHHARRGHRARRAPQGHEDARALVNAYCAVLGFVCPDRARALQTPPPLGLAIMRPQKAASVVGIGIGSWSMTGASSMVWKTSDDWRITSYVPVYKPTKGRSSVAELDSARRQSVPSSAATRRATRSCSVVRPAASDWMTADEVHRLCELQAALVPYAWEEREEARVRVAAKRAARVAERAAA
jgi:hypothetical protein